MSRVLAGTRSMAVGTPSVPSHHLRNNSLAARTAPHGSAFEVDQPLVAARRVLEGSCTSDLEPPLAAQHFEPKPLVAAQAPAHSRRAPQPVALEPLGLAAEQPALGLARSPATPAANPQ
jgi:hypothetical protein